MTAGSGGFNLRRRLSSVVENTPGIGRVYQSLRWKAEAHLFRARCYLHDWRMDRHHIGWGRRDGHYWRLSSELIFQHHKLEKGLCLPAESQRFFGVDPARATIRLLREWQEAGLDTGAPVYQSSLGVLRAWRQAMDALPSPPEPYAALSAAMDEPWTVVGETSDLYQTPIPFSHAPRDAFETLERVARARRSVRSYDGRPVDFSLVKKAIELAQLSPSACNRQPWRLHFYEDRADIDRLLAYQNGNRGFGQTIPLLAIVTCDYGSFFDASERFEPALDGGLFLMSFLLALQSQGLSSCCLNWCVAPETDIAGHEAAGIPHEEKILTFLAIGVAREDAMTPLSARRPLSDVIRRHDRLAR